MAAPLTGEIQEYVDGRWRTVHLGDRVTVRDRRRLDVDRPPAFPPKDRGEDRSERR